MERVSIEGPRGFVGVGLVRKSWERMVGFFCCEEGEVNPLTVVDGAAAVLCLLVGRVAPELLGELLGELLEVVLVEGVGDWRVGAEVVRRGPALVGGEGSGDGIVEALSRAAAAFVVVVVVLVDAALAVDDFIRSG